MSTAWDETVSCCFFIWELLQIGKFQRKFEGIFLSISFECNLQRHCSGMILWNDFYCLWESLSCSFLWMEMAPKSSFQHLASLSWDQLTSKVLKLYVCRCEGAMVTFIRASEGRVWVCPHLLTGDVLLCDLCVCVSVQEGTETGTIRKVHVQQDGRWTQHVNHPQHPTERRG